jgi:hypothetical protein
MTRKKRIVATSGAVILALSLTACTVPAETPAAPAPVQDYQPEPYRPPANTSDAAYLSTIREQIPKFGSVPDEKLVSAAEKACDALDVGVPATDLVTMAMDVLELDPYDAGFFIGAGIGVYCPENAGDLA